MNHHTTLTPGIEAVIGTGRPAFPGEVQDPADAASAAAEWERRYGEPTPRIRDGRDLLLAVADFLATLGLEPDVRGDEILFLFLGHQCRIELADLERRTVGITATEVAMLAAGIPVG